ncbi:unnamed protein product [Brachionus calyciflorus]|uniref:Uncharacterized protein n=1 Tax=Brachionus calyciflorus TaxID=104777 RepID=A0A813X081_9BILA|nr:unnamed protein product [Brachionus calyciflorus]
MSDSNFKLWVDKLYSLALVPIHLIPQAIAVIEKSIPNGAQPIYDYFKENWLSRPLESWNISTNKGPKTNNHPEGFHCKFNRNLGAAHPNIYKLIRFFKTREANVSVDFATIKLKRFESLKPRKNKNINREIKFNYIIRDLLENKISIEDFF